MTYITIVITGSEPVPITSPSTAPTGGTEE